MEWQKATLFISSTFNDMHAERDYLVKEVFPELEDWAEKRKVRLTEVDLRWGITEEESKNKGTVGTCLRHIDKCRPFFICFLGQKIGWIPDFDKDINNKTKLKYPTIKDIVQSNSLTEIEITHSMFSPLPQQINGEIITCPPTKYNLFFFRKDDYIENLSDNQKGIYTNLDNHKSDEKLEDLKFRILERQKDERLNVKVSKYSGKWDSNLILPELSHYGDSVAKGRLVDFRCEDKSLKEVIIKELKEQIAHEFPKNIPMKYNSKSEEDFDRQDIFIYKNNEDYIERSNYISIVKDYIENDDNLPFIIGSPSGYGKTMLLSKLVKDFDDEYPNKKLIKRFCGASSMALECYSLWKSIIDEAGIEGDCDIYPNNYDELKNNFEDILNSIAKMNDCVIVIDSINQVSSGTDILNWISSLPANLKIIASITEDKKIIRHNASKDSIFLDGLNDNEKKDLIKTYLRNYLKELDEKEIDAICRSKGSENPLYLKILLAELRVFGSFDQLESKIKKFGPTPETAFDHVLERLEEDEKLKGKENLVPLIFHFLSDSDLGLSEKDLNNLIKSESNLDEKYIQDTVRVTLRQVRQYMVKKEGRHDFFYESFKDASKKRYGHLKSRPIKTS